MQVKILTYGGIIQSIQVPGRGGREADVVLGFKTLQDYVSLDSPAVTANGGPVLRRDHRPVRQPDRQGHVHIGRHTYTLPINNGVNSPARRPGRLRQPRVGRHRGAQPPARPASQLKLVSPNGDDGANVGCTCTGYPGQLTVFVTFTLNNASQLTIHYRATTTQDTVLNLTNHSYFNLAGEASGATYGQKVQINANSYTPTDATQIPTGVIAPVRGTPFDFTRPADHRLADKRGQPATADRPGL